MIISLALQRRKQSTEDALVNFVGNLNSSINNNNKKPTGIFIDLRKAFDIVDHNILIKKLESAGIEVLP